MKMKEKKASAFSRVVLTLAAVFTLAIASGVTAKAAPAAPTGLKQVDGETSAAYVQWNAVAGATEYHLYGKASASATATELGKTTQTDGKVDLPVGSGATYWIAVAAADATGTGTLSQWLEVASAPGATTSVEHTKSTGTSITLQWGAVSEANIYEIQYYKVGTQNVKVATTTDTTATLKGLSKNAEYDVLVFAGKKLSNGYTQWAQDGCRGNDVPVVPQKFTSVKVTYDGKLMTRVKFTTNKRTSQDGIQVEVRNLKNKKLKTLTVSGSGNQNIVSSSLFQKNTFYKIRVRSYCKTSTGKKCYSAWSAYTYTSRQPKMNPACTRTADGVKIKWKKISGATRYVIYVSDNLYFGYKKFKTTTAGSALVTKYGKSNLQHGQDYYIYVTAQKKVKGKWYKSGVRTSWRFSY